MQSEANWEFPNENWKHLRTTDPFNLPSAGLRLRTDAAKRYRRVDRAIAVIWKMLMEAESRFRRPQSQVLLMDVYQGAEYIDGSRNEPTIERVAG